MNLRKVGGMLSLGLWFALGAFVAWAAIAWHGESGEVLPVKAAELLVSYHWVLAGALLLMMALWLVGEVRARRSGCGDGAGDGGDDISVDGVGLER